MMQLDDVVDATHTDPQRFEEARHRTVRWLDRCIVAHTQTDKQNLFPIGKKHALKKYEHFALNTTCFWGSTGSNITPVVQFHEIFVTKIMNKLIYYYIVEATIS